MPPSLAHRIAASAVLTSGALLLASAVPAQTPARQSGLSSGDIAAMAKARADSARLPYTAADIHFMQGMIGHHSQAIAMSKMAPTHDANPAVLRLAERIISAQQDEIVTMQNWLRDRNQTVPDGAAPSMAMAMDMPDMAHDMGHEMAHDSSHAALMPGMLTPAQMAQLDSARGADFDRAFLTFMMQHHRGALSMVKQLFNSYGAAQDETVFKFANDVNVDQTTEISRMALMLLTLPPAPRAP